MNYKDIQDKVMGRLDDNTGSTRERVKDYINEAYNIVYYDRDWYWRLTQDAAFTTTSGTEEYTLASGTAKIIDIRDTTNDTYLGEAHYLDLVQDKPGIDSGDSGHPTKWYYSGDSSQSPKIKLYPIPNGSYAMEYDYYKKLTELSADADEPDIPDRWQQILIDYALYQELLAQNDSRYSIYNTNFENTFTRMRNAEATISNKQRVMRWVRARN